MATFRPTIHTCKLNFDDKFTYDLPLNDGTLRRIAHICEEQVKALRQLKDDDRSAIDEAYNLSLDALDDMLGDGAGADIMSIFDDPGITEIAQVVTYISEEYTENYKTVFPGNQPAPVIGKRGRR